MRTLENHKLLYDAECAMCKRYTQALVTNGMLAEAGRNSYQNEADTLCPIVDWQKAADEIALIDLKTGEVTYGVISLCKIIGSSLPVLKPLFSFKPFLWIISKFYAFLAYNRRVIIPPNAGAKKFAFQPTLKKHYRLAYLLFTWFCTGFILTKYAHLLVGLVPPGNGGREYMICGGQIIFQALVISTFADDKLWSYLGNMMTISFVGSLLLLLPLAVSHWVTMGPLFFVLYFMGVAGLMLLEHIRRTKLLNLGWALTVTWVLYRIALLLMIIT